MVGFTNIDMGILIIYLLAVLLVGLAFSKKEMQGKEFFKGDGTIPWWVTSDPFSQHYLAQFPFSL